MFRAPEEDLGFGWYVPVFSLYVLWTQRERIRSAAGGFSWAGFLANVPFLLLALLGTRGLQLRFEQVAFIGLCVTLPWTFFGWRCARQFLFPAAYLAFTIPLASFLDVVTIHLRYLASGTALTVLNGFGVSAERIGTAIVATGAHPFRIDVAEPCSGLRSLFALMALTAGYAYFTQTTWIRRGLLFLCSIPLAVLGNVTRILTICLVAACADPKFATGFYHDYSGYVVFFVAISLMVACGDAISRFAPGARQGAPATDADAVDAPPAAAGSVVPVFAAVLLVAVFLFQSSTPDAIVSRAPEVVPPAALDGFKADDVCFCQDEQCGRSWARSDVTRYAEERRIPVVGAGCPACGGKLDGMAPGEKRILPADTHIVKRLYRAADGGRFQVGVVVGGASKSSIHRPELCLPAQGYAMSEPENRTVRGRPWRIIRVGTKAGGPPGALAYTFFNQEGFVTASHTARILRDTWDRSVLNRVDRWVMVTVNASALGASFEAVLDGVSAHLETCHPAPDGKEMDE